ncbi:hypothetical protein [Burkholderia sp. BCC0322]|uniref:hypothetical protein n=1 Tax=unclassified Burkholderia TaxID=2613784 RepID=UPI00158877C8|nr:hypothetical protein [Burkholderia sp. BCC0322]
MIFFAWSAAGVAAFEKLSRDHLDYQLWVSGGILAHDHVTRLRSTGVRVTEFTHEVRPEHTETLAHAIDVIREHHPDEPIWVES